MLLINETQKTQILLWRNNSEKACRFCEKALKEMNLKPDVPMTVGQAKRIIAWDIYFLRIKVQMAELANLRYNKPVMFPSNCIDALDTTKQAIKHGRDNIIGEHVHRALGVLQRAKANQKPVQEYFAEGNPSVTDSDSNETVTEGFKQALYNDAVIKKQHTEYIKQLHQKWLEGARYALHRKKPECKDQEKYKKISDKFAAIDENVIEHARLKAKENYDTIKNNHDSIEIWLDIVKEAYSIANKNADAFFDKVAADIAHRKQIKDDLMKGFVSLAMSPFLLNYFIDPALLVFSDLAGSATALATTLAQASTSASSNNSIMSEIQRQFFTFLNNIGFAVGTNENTIKKMDQLREESPVEFVELMQRFSDYKLHGFAKEMSQAFNKDTTVWNGHTPEEIVLAQRMKLVRQEQEKMDAEEWQDAKKDKFNEFFESIQGKLDGKFEEMLDKKIFPDIHKQYPKKNDIEQIQKIIKLLSFDEKASGLEAVKMNKRNELVKALADQIEINMVIKYACTYDEFFGGNVKQAKNHIKLISEHTFDPYEHSHFGLKADQQGKAILDHLIQKMPDLKDKLEPLKKMGYRTYWRCLWEIKTTETQKARQSVLNEIIQDYANGDLSAKLKNEVFKFAKSNKINLNENTKQSTSHKWIAEETLRSNANKTLDPLIQEADKFCAFTKKQLKYTHDTINEMCLVMDVPSSLNNQAMESIPNSRRLFEV